MVVVVDIEVVVLTVVVVFTVVVETVDTDVVVKVVDELLLPIIVDVEVEEPFGRVIGTHLTPGNQRGQDPGCGTEKPAPGDCKAKIMIELITGMRTRNASENNAPQYINTPYLLCSLYYLNTSVVANGPL